MGGAPPPPLGFAPQGVPEAPFLGGPPRDPPGAGRGPRGSTPQGWVEGGPCPLTPRPGATFGRGGRQGRAAGPPGTPPRTIWGSVQARTGTLRSPPLMLGSKAGRALLQVAVRHFRRSGAQGGWVVPPPKVAVPPQTPLGRRTSWSRVLDLGSGGSRGDPQGCGAGPTPGVAGTASPRPGGHPGGLGGTPPFRGAVTLGVRGYPPARGPWGSIWGLGGTPPQTPPGALPGHPPPRGVRRGVPGGYRGGPRDPPGPRGAKKCTFFWVFNNSPSRDKDGTLFWDKFRLRWDSSASPNDPGTPYGGPLWGPPWGVPPYMGGTRGYTPPYPPRPPLPYLSAHIFGGMGAPGG